MTASCRASPVSDRNGSAAAAAAAINSIDVMSNNSTRDCWVDLCTDT